MWSLVERLARARSCPPVCGFASIPFAQLPQQNVRPARSVMEEGSTMTDSQWAQVNPPWVVVVPMSIAAQFRQQ